MTDPLATRSYRAQGAVSAIAAQGEAPGVQWAVGRSGEPVQVFAAGVADAATQRPVDRGTIFLSSSTTKLVTAILVLQAVERGLLSLDRPLDAVLPDLPYPPDITIGMILAHASGLPNPNPITWVHTRAQAPGFDERGALDRAMAKAPRLTGAAGARYVYSNLGYWLLGRVLEHLGGQPYDALVQEQVARPLGLAPGELSCAFPPPERAASGHVRRFSLISVLPRFHRDFSFAPFRVDAPFFVGTSTIEVVAEPAPKECDPPAVRDVYGTNVGKMRDDALTAFYQRARAIALCRTNRINENWQRLSAYDAQSVFKFLEAGVELSRRLFVVPPDEMLAARDWMSNAISQRPKIVAKGIRTTAVASKIVDDVDNSEGVRFTALWRAILALPDCQSQLPMYQAYLEFMRQVPIGSRTDNLVKVTGVSRSIVELAIAKCLAENVKAGLLTGTAADDALRAQLKSLEEISASSSDAFTQNRIPSDIEVLNGLISGGS